MIKITNPLTKPIYILFEGTKYSIEAGDSIIVKPALAEFWLKIHAFIKVDEVKQTVLDVMDEPSVVTEPTVDAGTPSDVAK